MTAVELVPRLIVGVGLLHIATGFVDPRPWLDMAQDGLVNTIDDGPRGFTFWFVIAGVLLVAFGALAGYVVRATGTLPTQVGWWMIAPGVLVIVVMPASGAYLNVLVGLFALWAAHRASKPHTAGDRRAP